MNILYITNGFCGAGGLERVLSIKASYLAEHYGYEVTICSLNEQNLKPFYNFSTKVKLTSIVASGNPFGYIKSYTEGLKSKVGAIQPDIICVCDDGLKGFFLPYILKKNIPIVYERHVSKEIELQKDASFLNKMLIKAKWQLMEKLAAKFSKFIVLTEGNKNEWKSLTNIKVIANPLSFYPDKVSTLRNKQVIAVGKQSYQKGYDLLLKAWAVVSKQNADWQLNIYGTIDQHCKLEEQALKLNIVDSVFFHPPEKNIETKYLESSIYVMSSRFEGFGMVLIEAMACGVPCVSFDCNYGPSDIIEHSVDGLIVESGDVDGLAIKINELIVNDNLRLKMGANARENVKRFKQEMILEQWNSLFKTLVN